MSSPDALLPTPNEVERFLCEQREAWRARLAPGPSAETPLAIATSQRLVATLARELRPDSLSNRSDAPQAAAHDRHRADALLLEGDLAAARRLQEQLASAAESAFGYTDPRTLQLKTDLALTLYELKEFELAKQLQVEVLQDALSLREDDDTHEDVLGAMLTLARILLQITGEDQLALPLSQHVFTARLDALGLDDPATVAARDMLVEAKSVVNPGHAMEDLKDLSGNPLLLPPLGWLPFKPPGGDHHH